VEKMITSGMLGTVAVQRALAVKVGNAGAKKIVSELSPKYKDRKGGYTRITKLPARLSDNTLMAVIEFV
jgi:large subunit ribosomal protein L17